MIAGGKGEDVKVRDYRSADLPAMCRVFYEAVHHAAMPYSSDQRRAWAPAPPDPADWEGRLRDQVVLVAEGDGVLLGFMTLRENGYLDLAYVAPDAQGRGVADALYRQIENQAMDQGLRRLTVAASHPARSFFRRQGWTQVEAQVVSRSGVDLENFRMEKRLSFPGRG